MEASMLITLEYDRARAVEYARRWALARNPLFLDFTGLGGNCTNFVSQCIFAYNQIFCAIFTVLSRIFCFQYALKCFRGLWQGGNRRSYPMNIAQNQYCP